MTPDPDRPETLLSVANEIEAATIVGYLDQCGIRAFAAGGYTSGFKAEAPGNVKILVKQADLDRARQALAEHKDYQLAIDWSKMDVTEREEELPPAGENNCAKTQKPSDTFRSAFKDGILLQVVFFVLTALVTAHVLNQICVVAILGYWIGLVIITARRPKEPTHVDLFFVRWGIVWLMIVVPFLAKLVYVIIGESELSGLERLLR